MYRCLPARICAPQACSAQGGQNRVLDPVVSIRVQVTEQVGCKSSDWVSVCHRQQPSVLSGYSSTQTRSFHCLPVYKSFRGHQEALPSPAVFQSSAWEGHLFKAAFLPSRLNRQVFLWVPPHPTILEQHSLYPRVLLHSPGMDRSHLQALALQTRPATSEGHREARILDF